MPQLSAVDQAFFLLETSERPMNIGALIVLVPPSGSERGFANRLVSSMLTRPVGPPFNYHLRTGPIPGLHWFEADQHMDPAPQVHRHALRHGSELAALCKRVCDLHVRPLSRDAPLWELHVFTGLPQSRVALYFKTHHGLIDGIGFIRILNTMFSTRPSMRSPRAIWEGMLAVATPTGATQRGEGSRRLQQALEVPRTALDTVRLLWRQGLRSLGRGPGLPLPFFTPNVLKAAPSPHRAMAHCQLPLRQVRRIATHSGAKVNDVLLAVLDIAMNRYLEERNLVPDKPLVADVPVALEDHGGAGNRITILQVPMGIPRSRPADRLRRILSETRQVKQEVQALAGGSVVLYSIVHHAIASAIESLGLVRLPMLANAVISNVSGGLQRRAYFNGAAMALGLPVSVVAHHQALNITITTYMQDLHVTFMALREAIPGIERLAQYTVEAVSMLEADLRRRPGRGRRRGGSAWR